MKVLHVTPSFNRKDGGLAYAVKNIADSLNVLPVEQVIVTAGQSDMSVARVEIIQFPYIGNFRAHQGFADWLQENVAEFDLVHIHSIWLFHSRLAARCARNAGVPYVVSPHGMLDDWSMSQKAVKKWTYLWLFENTVLKNAAALHCTLRAEAASRCVRRLNVRAEVVPLAIEGAFFQEATAERNPNQILYLGRLHYKKQPDVLIKAFTAVAEARPELKLVIAGVGDAAYVKGLMQLAQSCRRSISFIGQIDGSDKVRLFRESQLFALPSLQENFGITVAEAMASGAVPVVSDQVALSDAIRESRAGFVSEANLESFQASLQEALQADQIARCRSNGEAFAAENFSQRVVGDRFHRFYRAIAELAA